MKRTLWAMAAVMAIFAMHGLATHASAHEPVPAQQAQHGQHLTSDAEAASADVVGSMKGEGHPMSALGLCVAVLTTAAVALLQVIRPRSGILATLPRLSTVPSHPVSHRSGHGPPDLHALSVLRC